jgi:L-asparaginase
MLASTLLILALAALGHASLILIPHAGNTTSPFIYANSFGLNFTQMDASLPNVTIFATGGYQPIHPCERLY